MKLVLLAHQDDEFGCFSLLEQMVFEAEDFKVIYLTSGVSDGGNPVRRNRESIDVLRRLGVESTKVLFLGAALNITDGTLHRHLARAFDRLLQVVGPDDCVSMVLSTAWEGGHQDHDAVYLLALAISLKYQCMSQSRQFPLYHGKNLPFNFFKVLSPIEENGDIYSKRLPWSARFRYLLYCSSYPSQYKTWIGLLPFVILSYLFKGYQSIQSLKMTCVDGPPHRGSLLYERRDFCSRSEFNNYKDIFIRDVMSRFFGS